MTGKIYFVSAPGRIKIGYTKKPEVRLKQLRANDMEEITTIAVVDGTMRIEHRLHDMVRDFNIRGEWFRDCPEVRALIDGYVSGRLVFDRFGEDHPAQEENSSTSTDYVEGKTYALTAAISEAGRIADEIGQRIARREDISELTRAACFLATQVIAPLLYGPPDDAARKIRGVART